MKSVSEVTRHIKALIDADEALNDLWIEGEISNFTRATSGHCYFSLKDSEAEIRCVMWRQDARNLPWSPAQGDAVDAHGYVSVYEQRGAYQFYVDTMNQGGMGLRWQQFLELKSRLEAEGLFDESRKRSLPAWPRRIGVVTSSAGAALRDILNVLRERYPLVEVVLSPSLVQGNEAPEALVRALRRLGQVEGLDAAIIARGGGSIEDLWAFNDERVARAVATFKVPIVSGVGHETDFTITDFCADLRTPTPSTAAAAVVPDGRELKNQVEDMVQTLTALVMDRIARWRERLEREKHLLRSHDPRRTLAQERQRVDDLVARARAALARLIKTKRMDLDRCRASLRALHPYLVMKRGYAVVQDPVSGDRIQSVRQTSEGSLLDIYLQDGNLGAEVTRIVERTEGDQRP
ncbi:MAG: exodeoxyribonuclease VII large subunit [Chloroflexota bacterium]|nr:exodeoxyribonuclease VII large subunit [Chloroflexota bacterium]